MTEPIPVVFESKGANVRGLSYKASGVRPLPTVILCRGFPGNDGDVFGLGERSTKEGFNARALSQQHFC